MGGSDNKWPRHPRRYRVPGQPLLNRHQVGGVSRSPDGLFAQQEREPIRGRPSVRRLGQHVEEQGTWASCPAWASVHTEEQHRDLLYPRQPNPPPPKRQRDWTWLGHQACCKQLWEEGPRKRRLREVWNTIQKQHREWRKSGQNERIPRWDEGEQVGVASDGYVFFHPPLGEKRALEGPQQRTRYVQPDVGTIAKSHGMGCLASRTLPRPWTWARCVPQDASSPRTVVGACSQRRMAIWIQHGRNGQTPPSGNTGHLEEAPTAIWCPLGGGPGTAQQGSRVKCEAHRKVAAQ